jgi:anti-sigma regulatory factor (Ser/Thr protein kinase)
MSNIDDRLRLPPEPASAGHARRFVADVLSSCPIDIELVSLLVSELVSNVVLHAHTPFEVEVRNRGGHIRVSVADGSPVMPSVKQYAPDSVTGRGLTMIDLTAERWGIDENADGKAVWFEVPFEKAITQ